MGTIRNGDMEQLFPKRFDESGKRICRYCGGPLPKGRRWWCSDICVDEAKIRCWPHYAAEQCFKRDNYTCRNCGLEDVLKWRYLKIERPAASTREDLKSKGYDVMRSLLECHHIVTVKDGGGACGLDNLITLCQFCHNATKRQSLEVLNACINII